eukprot:gene1356-21698_t
MKNRFNPSLDLAMTGGYMDFQLLVIFKCTGTDNQGGVGGVPARPTFAVGEIQLNLASCIDIKEGVAANGGGGHGPYKRARSFNGYSPETVYYTGTPTMALAKKIETGMLLGLTFTETSGGIGAVGKAMQKAFESPQCRIQRLDFGGNGALFEQLMSKIATKHEESVLYACQGAPQGVAEMGGDV